MGLKLSCLKGKVGGSPPPALLWVGVGWGLSGEGRNEAGEDVSVDLETLVLLPWRGRGNPT